MQVRLIAEKNYISITTEVDVFNYFLVNWVGVLLNT